MTNKFTKYGRMIIAAVLLIGVLFAGAGSGAEVYINNADDWINNKTTLEAYGYEYDTIILTGDIDFQGRNQDAFVLSTCSRKIDGFYNGVYHTISNFSISNDNQVGLIRNYTNSQTGTSIANLTICNYSVTGSGDRVGGLIGNAAYNLNMTNVHAVSGTVSGTAQGTHYVGGLVGLGSRVELHNCDATNCSVSAPSCVGGLIGYVPHSARFYGCEATNCYVGSGSFVFGSDNCVGGLIGSGCGEVGGDTPTSTTYMHACVVKDSILMGHDYVGGLAGWAHYGNLDECTVLNSSVSGNSYVGGLIGMADSVRSSPFIRACVVKNCIISASEETKVGGLVGYARINTATNGIESCMVEDSVIAGKPSDSHYVGGFIGYAEYPSNFTNGGNWLNKSAVRGNDITTVAWIVGLDNTSKCDTAPGVSIQGGWLNNNSGSQYYPKILIAKSANPAKQGPEPSYFNDTVADTVPVGATLVTSLDGYGVGGKYKALAYVFPNAVPEYGITNTSYSNGTVSAYDATTSEGPIDRAKAGDLVKLVAENTGYHVVAWNVTNSTGPISPQPDSTGIFTMPAEAVNVDAVSFANETTVYFRDGEDYDPKMNTYGTAINFSAPPSKPGYSFMYWNVSSTGLDLNSSTYVDNGIWKYTGEHGGNLHVWATWSLIEYNITYDVDGGTTTNPTKYNITSPVIELTNAAKSGYTFEGWYNDSAKSPAYRNSTIPAGSTGDKTFWANFTANVTTVTFHTDAGTEDKLNTYGTAINFSATPSKPGYSFTHWNVSSTGLDLNSSTYVDNGIWKYTGVNGGALDVWANWSLIEYNITYDVDGGTTTNPTKYNITSPVIELTNAAKSGYTFEGWYNDSAKSPAYRNSTIPAGSTGDKTFWANFTANVTTVYFHNESGLIESKLNTYGQAINFSATPTKSGFAFKCWAVSSTGLDLNSSTYVDNGIWKYAGVNGGTLDVWANWTVIPTPTPKKHSESKDMGSTVILTETVTPTPVPTATPTATAVPTIATVKPTSQQTSKSPAPFIGLIAGLGAAAALLRLRK